ncbi:MAG TPA: AMP-binding protein [Steroidobacteraceae bacterium]|nr:AMP-binding protein [Steroidobacteraceae bacterium]
MILRSPHPEVRIPRRALYDFVLGERGGRAGDVALADAATGRVVTYGDLRECIRRVAAGLAALGISKGDIVALWSPNSPEFAIAFHAVARLGAIVTTANPSGTPHELALQLRDANAKMLITTAALADSARAAIAECGGAIELITTDDAPGVPSLTSIARDADPPPVDIDPDNDVVALPYSSGTTGLPKGVMLTHRNLVANLLQVDAIERGDLRALIGVLPFFHIYGMVVILNFGLMRGATIVTLPRFELEPFLKALQDWPIAVAHIVPPIAVALAKHPAVENYRLPHLEALFSGAAPLSAAVTNAVQRRLNVTLKQGYGMTEASPVTHYTAHASEVRLGTVGQLAPSTECRIVDVESGHDAGIGRTGEVWIRGPQIMKGYLNNPEATARTVDRDGWLHTGDIGMVDADGYLTIVDRLKELIKVKGYQVAPAELEALLLTHPGVADAAVIPVDDEECGQVPKALIVPRAGLVPNEVIAFVQERVAHYKRVRHVGFVDAIPKSASGKILRRVLMEREHSNDERAQAAAARLNP